MVPPAEYRTVKLVVDMDGEKLFASAKELKEPGYLEIAGMPKNSETRGKGETETTRDEITRDDVTPDNRSLLAAAAQIKKGDTLAVDGFSLREGKTSPPKRYTSGSMVLAMENAGQLIEEEELREQIKGSGIGTSATRAEIITSPPKRYTSGSMVLAMENAGQLIEEEELREQIKGSGIGTSATRAEIIRKLVRIGYLNLNKKTQVLTPERLGEMIFEVVSLTVPALLNPKMTASWEKGLDGITRGTVVMEDYRAKLEDFIRRETVAMITVPALLNPKMTASWEKGLDGITRGTVVMEDYRAKLEDFIRRETVAMIDRDLTEQIAARIHPFVGKGGRGLAAKKSLGVKCPVCDGTIETTPFGYGCSNYKKDGTGCRFSIGTIAGRDLGEEEVKALLTDGHTDVLTGFSSKSKKKFSASLILEKDEEGKVSVGFDFSKNQPELLPDVKCPVCGSAIEITPFGYTCVNHRENPEACYFSVGKIAGKALGVDDVTELLANGRTGQIRGFTAKNKKKFNAALVLETAEDGKKNIAFDFSQNEAQVIEDARCPVCGGAMLVKSFGYGCANYDPQNPESCRFSIGTLAGKDLNVSQVKELLANGRTGTIRGFKSKSGKKFDACVALARDEEGAVSLKFDFEHVEAKKVKDVVCPLCGGDIVQTPFGFGCANYAKDNPESCRFSIGKMAEKTLTEANVKELLTNGRTGTLRGFKFGCANYAKDNPESCRFSIGKMAEKTLTEANVKELLTNGRTGTLRGFKSKSGKKFDARVALARDEAGKVTGLKFDFTDLEAPRVKDVKCPLCGGAIVKTMFGYGCANYSKDNPQSCRFSIGRIAGVTLKEAQVKELLLRGRTEVISGFVAKTGMKFDAPLKLTEQGQVAFDFPEKPKPVETMVRCPKCGELLQRSQWYYECSCGFKVGHTVASVVAFDFPEKPKPVETMVRCPKCGELLQRSQWYYECSCGFKVGHTVASVALSEDVMRELLETGRTKEKISGFVSKAGNAFEACLKFADERISFDFENPGGEQQEEASQPKSQETGEEEMPYYDAMAEELAAYQMQEEAEQTAGMNFLDEMTP